MRRTMKLLMLILAGAGWLQAQACECPMPLREADMRAATQVFVFRLLSTQHVGAGDPDKAVNQVTGRIEVVERIRGDAAPSTLRYQRGPCCPTRMDTGDYYVAFLAERSQPAQVSYRNMLYIGADYQPRGRLSRQIAAVLARKAAFSAEALTASEDRLFAIPRPPEPACVRDGARTPPRRL